MKVGIYKANNTRGNSLIINDYRISGYKSGFGYTLIDEFKIDTKELQKLIDAENKTQAESKDSVD